MNVRYVLSSAQVGIAVAAVHAIAWPWGLVALAIPLVTALVFHRGELGRALLLYACVATALFTVLGMYALTTVRQHWLSTPELVASAVLAVVLGASWVALGTRKRQAEAALSS